MAAYTYNFNDRMTDITDAGDNWQFLYNGHGDRLASVHKTTEKRYTLDLSGDMSRILCETDSTGTITAYYVYGAGLLYKVTPDRQRIHYHYDPLGSTIALTDGSETVTDAYAYDPYGNLVNFQGSTENSFRFIGKYGVMDEGNGLLFMRARFYDPEMKRFLSRDPMKGSSSKTIGLNPYAYSFDAPTLFIDPDGNRGRFEIEEHSLGVGYFYGQTAINYKVTDTATGVVYHMGQVQESGDVTGFISDIVSPVSGYSVDYDSDELPGYEKGLYLDLACITWQSGKGWKIKKGYGLGAGYKQTDTVLTQDMMLWNGDYNSTHYRNFEVNGDYHTYLKRLELNKKTNKYGSMRMTFTFGDKSRHFDYAPGVVFTTSPVELLTDQQGMELATDLNVSPKTLYNWLKNVE